MNASNSLRCAARLLRQTFALAAAPFAAVAAQQPTAGPPSNPIVMPGDSAIRITLVTMGQGTPVYEQFGHNALWVHDPAYPIDVVYNWGVFDFHSQGFLVKFLLGDMRYTMAGETVQDMIAVYTSRDRQLVAQELNLTPAEKRAIVEFIRWNSLPENRPYRYDYYRDNCSTRVRDIIDRATRGQLRAYLKSIPTDETYRSHSLRLMQGGKLLVTGVDLALGRPTDFKLNADEASFLPVQLMNYVRDFKLDGATRPLVKREYVMYQAERAPEAAHAPAMWKGLLPVGLLLAGAVLLLGFRVRRRAPAVTLIAILAGLMGLIGSILTLLVTITDHVAAHSNENMFMLNPIWLIVAVAAPLAIGRGRAMKLSKYSAFAAIVVAAGAVLIHLIGLSRQPNWDVIGLLLPPQLAIAYLAMHKRAGTTS